MTGDILMNSTSIGMHAMEGQSPVDRKALQGYRLVFDAIYTPLRTRLIQVHHWLPSLKQGSPLIAMIHAMHEHERCCSCKAQ